MTSAAYSHSLSFYENIKLAHTYVISSKKNGTITRTILENNLAKLLELCNLDSEKYFANRPLFSRIISGSFPYDDINGPSEIVRQITVTLDQKDQKIILQAYWRVFLGDLRHEIEKLTNEWESTQNPTVAICYKLWNINEDNSLPGPLILLGLYIKYDSFTINVSI